MTELNVFHDGQDWFVAESIEDAALIRSEMYPDEEPEDFEELSRLPDDEVIGVLCNELGEPDDHGTALNKTASEWARQVGRGVLCSTDF